MREARGNHRHPEKIRVRGERNEFRCETRELRPLRVVRGGGTARCDARGEQAIADLEKGNTCLISDWHATRNGIKIGDRISVAVPQPNGPADREYRVAGIVELSGWRMMTKMNKVRIRGDKHRVLVVLDANAVRRDFPVAYAN